MPENPKGKTETHRRAREMDETILRLFQVLSREEKQQFLTFFENAPERRSSPASDRRQHGKEDP